MAYFHFFHNTSMETLSCQCDESTLIIAMQNSNFVEANIMNISVKYQLHRFYGF